MKIENVIEYLGQTMTLDTGIEFSFNVNNLNNGTVLFKSLTTETEAIARYELSQVGDEVFFEIFPYDILVKDVAFRNLMAKTKIENYDNLENFFLQFIDYSVDL